MRAGVHGRRHIQRILNPTVAIDTALEDCRENESGYGPQRLATLAAYALRRGLLDWLAQYKAEKEAKPRPDAKQPDSPLALRDLDRAVAAVVAAGQSAALQPANGADSLHSSMRRQGTMPVLSEGSEDMRAAGESSANSASIPPACAAPAASPNAAADGADRGGRSSSPQVERSSAVSCSSGGAGGLGRQGSTGAASIPVPIRRGSLNGEGWLGPSAGSDGLTRQGSDAAGDSRMSGRTGAGGTRGSPPLLLSPFATAPAASSSVSYGPDLDAGAATTSAPPAAQLSPQHSSGDASPNRQLSLPIRLFMFRGKSGDFTLPSPKPLKYASAGSSAHDMYRWYQAS